MKSKSNIIILILVLLLFGCSDDGSMTTPPPSDNGAVVIPPILPVASVKQNLSISSFNFPAESSDWKYVAGNSKFCYYWDYSSSLTLQMLSYMGKANTGEIPNAYFCAHRDTSTLNSSVYYIRFYIIDYDNSSLLYFISMEQSNPPYLENTYYNTLSEMLYWIKKKPTESYSGYIYTLRYFINYNY